MAPKGVKPHVAAAADEITARFGITNIGGLATSGHIPGSDHYTGLALDVMLGNSGKGDIIAAWTLENAARLSVKYVIYNRRYNGLDGKGWVPYTGTNPHTDHVHISFKAMPGGTAGDPGDIGTGTVGNATTDPVGCLKKLLGL
jgi:hypothetical protein